jgi:hypothetical protein
MLSSSVRVLRLIAACVAVFTFVPAWGADVTGTWQFSVTTPAGTGTPTLKLAQQGEAVTGTYDGQLGHAPVTGTMKGDALEISFTASGMMGAITVTYSGTVDGDDVSGKVKLGDLGEGTFTGKRTGS